MKSEEKNNAENKEEIKDAQTNREKDSEKESGKNPGRKQKESEAKKKKKSRPRDPAAKERHRIGRAVAGTLILCLFTLFIMLTGAIVAEYVNSVTEMQAAVDSVADSYIADTDAELEIENSFMTTCRSEVSVIANILSGYDIQKYGSRKRLEAVEGVMQIRENSASRNLYICDPEGTLFLASDENWLDINLLGIGKFTESVFRELIEGAETAGAEAEEGSRCYLKLVNGLGYCFSRKIMTSAGEPSGYYLIMVYDQATVNRGIDLSIDKTVLANALTARYELMDMFITRDGTVIYSTDGESTEDLKLELVGGSFFIDMGYAGGGTWGSLEAVHESTGEKKTHSIAYRRTFSRKNGEQYAVCAYLNIYKTDRTFNWLFGGVMGSCFALLVLVLLYLIYCVCLFGSVGTARRYRILSGGAAFLCLFLFFLSAMYFQSLGDLTGASKAAETVSGQIHSLYEQQDGRYAEVAGYYQNSDLTKAELIAYDIEYSGDRLNRGGEMKTYYSTSADGRPVVRTDSLGNPLRCRAGSEMLSDKADVLSGADIWLITENGFAVASSSETDWSFDLNGSELEDTARKVMYGELPGYVSYTVDEDGEYNGSVIICPAVIYAVTDGAGETAYLSARTWETAKVRYDSGYPKAGKPRELMGVLLVKNSTAPAAITACNSNFVNNVQTVAGASGCCYALLSYDEETGRTEVTDKVIGTEKELELAELSVPDAVAEVSVFNYFQKISNQRCYVRIAKDYTDTVAGAVVMPVSDVHRRRNGLVMYYMVCALFLLLLTWCRLQLIARKRFGKGRAPEKDSVYDEAELRRAEDRELRRGLANAVKSRLAGEIKDAPAGLRIPLLLVQLLLILTAVFIVVDMFDTGSAGFFTNIYGREWERCLNAYNLGAALALLMEVLIIFNFARTLVNLFCVPLGRRVETYARLAVSVIQYVLMFLGIFYGAYLLGMEVKSIGTIATVIAGVIGIGSQQLISDVGSGIALLADGRYMIGDLVTADGFRGIIREIGIRNCVLVDENGLEKSVSNGKMSCAVLIRRNAAAILRAEEEKKAAEEQKAAEEKKAAEEQKAAEEKKAADEQKAAETGRDPEPDAPVR